MFVNYRRPHLLRSYRGSDRGMYWAPKEWYRLCKADALGEKRVSVPLKPSRILHGQVWDWTRASAVRGGWNRYPAFETIHEQPFTLHHAVESPIFQVLFQRPNKWPVAKFDYSAEHCNPHNTYWSQEGLQSGPSTLLFGQLKKHL
jgi:hypothetical protein